MNELLSLKHVRRYLVILGCLVVLFAAAVFSSDVDGLTWNGDEIGRPTIDSAVAGPKLGNGSGG